MADVVHEHTTDSSGSGINFIMGIVLLVVALILIFYFGLPYLRNASSGTQITVPDKIDVNINRPAQ